MAIKAVQSGSAGYAYPEKTKEGKEGMDYQKFLREKILELNEKFKKGECEPSYQIGAASYTEKEWDNLLEKFDTLQEEIRTQMREEHERRAQQEEKTADTRKKELAESVQEKTGTKKAAGQATKTGWYAEAASQEASLLSGAYTTATYPAASHKDVPDLYITCYTAEGIFCRKAGQSAGYEWMIPFSKEGEYDKVMEFIGRFPQDMNLRFSSRKNFWEDFLNDRIDVDGFMEFVEGSELGVPDYTVTDGESVFIDRKKAAWAKYMNQDIGQFYTAQEMEQMQAERIKENASKVAGYYEDRNHSSRPE